MILAAVLALGIGGYLWSQGPELTDGIGESFSLLSGGGGGSGGGGMDITQLGRGVATGEGGGGGGAGVREVQAMMQGEGGDLSVADRREGLRAADAFFDALDRPMTRRDLAQVREGMESWESSRPVQRFHGLLEEGEALGDDDSLMANARRIRVAVGLGFRVRDIVREYPEHVEKHGGEDYHAAYGQVAMMHRLSQLAASNTEDEPWEQATADSLLADHDENREAFLAARARIQAAGDPEAGEMTEEEQQELMETFSNQFVYMTSAVSRESLESWAALSDDERKAIGEQLDTPAAVLSRLVGHASDETGAMAFYMLAF